MSILSSENSQQSKAGNGDLRVATDYLLLLLEYASEIGVKQSQLLKDSGLAADILMNPPAFVGHESFSKVVRNFIVHQPDLYRAVEYGKRMTLSKHGALGIAARHSRTTDDAAARVTAFMKTRAEIFDVERKRDDKERCLTVVPLIEAEDTTVFIALAYLTSIEQILRQMLGTKGEYIESRILLPTKGKMWQGKESVDSPVELDKELSGTQLYFNHDAIQLIWPNIYLNDLLPLFDEDLVEIADQALEGTLESISRPETLRDAVERVLQQAEKTLPTIEWVASDMNMSAATLKRKLKAEESSFREIKDSVLFNKAVKALKETQLSVELIADKLGYSDASNFAKAFKGWSGMTPSEYRLQKR